MYRPRIIPVLLIKNEGLVKSVNFNNHKYIGDPLNAVRIFNDLNADELVFLDIDATRENRTISPDLVREIGEEANMPFSVGGGIKTIEIIKSLTQAGAERVIIGSEAISNPEFIKKAAEIFGSSTISVCLDVKRNLFRKEILVTHNSKRKHKLSPEEAAKKMDELGAGEIIIQSVDKDGTMEGFNIDLIKRVSDSVTIPIVALGGAGNYDHFAELFQKIPTSGIASGSKFVYQNNMKGVLINYPDLITKSKIYE